MIPGNFITLLNVVLCHFIILLLLHNIISRYICHVFSEIHQIFDAISYYKGANVIRMASAFIGEDKFLSGVKRYLRKYEYGNASTDDLWKALANTSGNDFGRFMTIWTKAVGVSIINKISHLLSSTI